MKNYDLTPINIEDITTMQLAIICDHTFLNRAEAYKEIAKSGENPVALRTAAFNNFLEDTVKLQYMPYAICVRPEDVKYTYNFLKDKDKSDIIIASVVGFPDGVQYSTEFKMAETALALENGAQEIDMVLNHELLRTQPDKAKREISQLAYKIHINKGLLKVILEVSNLTPQEIMLACQICNDADADFVKTSTGYSASGATVESLKIMKENFSLGIKMSGGVNESNVKELLYAASGRTDGKIVLNPKYIRIGESKLLKYDPNVKY